MPYGVLTQSLAAKTQADDAVYFDLTGYERLDYHELRITVSATPLAGTLAVALRIPGASTNDSTIHTVDLTATLPVRLQFTGMTSRITLTPVGFDADKTYTVYYAGKEQAGGRV
jgi:hypothetical protein